MTADQPLGWLPLLSGVLGSALTLIATALVFWIWRPRLLLSFTARTRGCVVDTPSLGGRQRVLRILVENCGWTSAHKVTVSAIKLKFYPLQGSPSVLADDVLEFSLALQNRSVFDLAPGAHRWVDVVYADDLGPDVNLRFGFAGHTPLRLNLLGFGKRGSYTFSVIATAENASATKTRISWHWDGSLRGLTIRGWWWPIFVWAKSLVVERSKDDQIDRNRLAGPVSDTAPPEGGNANAAEGWLSGQALDLNHRPQEPSP
jgi:hypothetical protein